MTHAHRAGANRLQNKPTTTTQAQAGVRFHFCETFRSSPVVDLSVHGDHGSGAAKQRRDRRLRMHWRHEQLMLQVALAAALHDSRDVGPVTYDALRSQTTARAGEWGREMNFTATIRDPPSRSPAGALQPLRRRARRWAAGQDRYPVPATGAGSAAHRAADRRRSPFGADSRRLRRRRWNSWSISSSSLACTHPSSKLSTCFRSHKTGLSSAWLTICVNRRRRNSWWQCLRSYPILLCTGMRSRTSTFQFLLVVVVGEVFKIYALDRFQKRFVEQFTWTIRFRVLEVFKVSFRDRLPLLHPRTRLVLRMRLSEGFSQFFSKLERSAGFWVPTRGRNWPRTRAHPRGDLMVCPWL